MMDAPDVVNQEGYKQNFPLFSGYIRSEQLAVLSYHLFHDFAI